MREQARRGWMCIWWYVTLCVCSVAPQGRWGVRPREDSPALGCTAPPLLPWPPRPPAPSPTALQRQQPPSTAPTPPPTTASTTRRTHRYCNTETWWSDGWIRGRPAPRVAGAQNVRELRAEREEAGRWRRWGGAGITGKTEWEKICQRNPPPPPAAIYLIFAVGCKPNFKC